MEEILELIDTRYDFTRTDAAYDSTAVRYDIPGTGSFGIIANESEPFCAACTRLRLSSNGMLYGCLSNAASHDIKPILASFPNIRRLPDCSRSWCRRWLISNACPSPAKSP